MKSGGHTTVIQRVLERRAEKPPTPEEWTTATIAIMARVLPPPKALLCFQSEMLGQRTERRIPPDALDFETVADEHEALRLFNAEFRPVVLTDNPELIRKLRSRQETRAPFVVYIAGSDDPVERDAGLHAGADESVSRGATEEEFNARVRAARRIAELEAVLRITMAENRKLSATD